jgi:hypothetical protein
MVVRVWLRGGGSGGMMFCPSKLIRTCSASLIYHFPPQSALDTTAIILSQMQSTQRQHTTQNSKRRRLRSIVRRPTPRSIIIPRRRRRRNLIRQPCVLITAAQTPVIRAVSDLKAGHEIAKRIGGAHIATRAAAVLDEYRAVSELGAAGLHARVPLGWLVFF